MKANEGQQSPNLQISLMILHWIVIITKKFEGLDFTGLCWPSLAFLAFVALENFFKAKTGLYDKN